MSHDESGAEANSPGTVSTRTYSMSARTQMIRTVLVGGLLPVIAFALIENYFGTLAGLVAGMVLGVGEVLYEWRRNGRVETMTWIANGMILVLGGVSLFSHEGYWFKLQPAILEFLMAGFLIGSHLTGAPVLVGIATKQGALEPIPVEKRPLFARALAGLSLRLGFFVLIHSFLATWAALYASTAVWALLKGVGFTGSMLVYLALEIYLIRRKIRQSWDPRAPLAGNRGG